MTQFDYKVQHPQTALAIIFVIGALLAHYGIVEGAALLFTLFAGMSLYRMLTGRN